MDSSRHYQGKDSVTFVGRRSPLGRTCTRKLTRRLDAMEIRIISSRQQIHTTLLFPKEFKIAFKQLHGFSDASERAYAGVVYLRLVDTNGRIHTSFVIAKTKVAPIKKLTIPRLELCGARLLAQLLHHCKKVFKFSLEDCTDSTIVLNWMSGNPRRFKTYVANRVSSIVELIPSNRWNHVGILPSELLSHKLWWEGPEWLSHGIQQWPLNYMLPRNQRS